MKTFTIIAGVNGCGKSSLTGVLRTELDNLGIIIDANNVSENKAIERIESCLERDICFTQETTLSGKRTLHTVQKAMAKDYFIRLYYVGLDTVDESLQRIANRVRKGGHNIDSTTVANRFAKRFDDLLAVLPYCNEATFYDNNNGFVTVAKYKNGELLPIGSNLPLWLQELMSRIKE